MNNSIKIWDPIVRIFHWSLVVAFFTCYFTQEEEYDLHLFAGYTIAGLVVVRIAWGFVGTRYARFSDFVCSPTTVYLHLKALLQRQVRHHIGHNPAGGAMVIFLLIAMITLTISGVALDAAENRAGPLGDTKLFFYLTPIQKTHDISTDITIALIALHILGVITQSLLSRENLVRAMITGRKKAHDDSL